MPTRPVLWLLLSGLLTWSACKDQPEAIPSYIRIEPFAINAGGDADWHKITDGWLYVNGEFLGAYSLPATVPVLAEGLSEVLVFPGIKENGISSTPNIYPIMTRFDQDFDLIPGQITTVSPSTMYDPAVTFPWSLDRGSFDIGSGSTLVLENRDTDPDVNFEIVSDSAFFGRSVLMRADTAHRLMQVATELVSLPATFEREVWLELHYRNDIPFTLWLVGQDATSSEVNIPVYQFNTTEGFEWNKIYINLTETLISLQDYDQYRLFFQVSLQPDIQGNFSTLSGRVYLDNIRLAHF